LGLAPLVGFGAVLFYKLGKVLRQRVFKVEDLVDAFAVYGMGGLWGSLSASLAALGDTRDARFMAFYGHDFKGSFWTQLSTQIIGIIIIVIWSVIGGLFIFTLVWSLGLFATDPENSKFNKVKNCILGKLRRPQDPYTNLSP